MVNESDRGLSALLFEGPTTLVNVKCFVGEGPFTEEDLREELRSAIAQRDSGAATVSSTFNDDAPKIDVRALIASLQ